MNYFHPERMPELPARRREAARRQLVALVESSPPPGRPRKSAAITAGAAVLVVTTGAAAFAVVGSQPVTDRAQARCYPVASASAGRYVSIGAASEPDRAAAVRNAVRVCAALFRQGILQVGVPGVITSANTAVKHPVPALVACTMSSGIAAVFPGGHRTCAELGLPSASGEP